MENDNFQDQASFPEVTLPETNIAPENGPSQQESSIPTTIFQFVSGRLVWTRVLGD